VNELILGGQKSGKSRCAEQRAADWLARPGHSAVLFATALDGDDEMHERIARHRADRALRLPLMPTLEVPRELAQAVRAHAAPQRLIVIDCLSLWLTNLLMPVSGEALSPASGAARRDGFCQALRDAAGPLLMVSSEIGLGVSPMTREARRFVDELGLLHQQVAALCDHVTMMVAGIECPVKRASAP